MLADSRAALIHYQLNSTLIKDTVWYRTTTNWKRDDDNKSSDSNKVSYQSIWRGQGYVCFTAANTVGLW